MKVIGVTADYGIGEGIAKKMGSYYCSFSSRLFPDGESYLKLGCSVKGEDVLLVQSMDSFPDKKLVELLIAIDAVKEAGGNRIYALVPYLAYARQDRVFTDGEPISSRSVLRTLRNAGVDALAVVEPHKSRELEYFEGKHLEIGALGYVVKKAVEHFEDPVLIAPDSGIAEKVGLIAKEIGLDWDYIEKKRDRNDGSLAMEKGLHDLGGKNALIVDDMVSTGGTALQAAKEAKAKGAARIGIATVHALMVNLSQETLKTAGLEEVYGSNSTRQGHYSTIDISEAVSDSLSGFFDA